MGASLNTSGIAGTPSSMPQQGAQPSSGGKGGVGGQAPRSQFATGDFGPQADGTVTPSITSGGQMGQAQYGNAQVGGQVYGNNPMNGLDPNAIAADPQGFQKWLQGYRQQQGTQSGPTPQGGWGAVNNPAQQQGQNVFNQASNALTSAFGGTQEGMAYQPERITAGGIARDAMSYGNPFESQVVESTLGDIERARQMQANQIGASATGAKAFGGSRHALMESELGRNSLEQASKAASGLRLGGWQNAQNLASQAAQSNQSAGLMGAQQRLGAASQMGNLANLGFGMGQQAQQMQMGAGNTAFALQQALIDAAKGQYGGYTGAPANSLGYMTSAIGATPNVSSQTQQYTPGLFDYLRLGTSFS